MRARRIALVPPSYLRSLANDPVARRRLLYHTSHSIVCFLMSVRETKEDCIATDDFCAGLRVRGFISKLQW